MTSRGHGRGGLCCGGCSKTLGLGWGTGEGISAGTPVPLIPRSCRAPSQGAAPGIPGEGQSPWMTQGSCWHSPALSVPSAARSCPSEPVAALAQLQEGQVWSINSPGTQAVLSWLSCSQGPLKLWFWGCIWEINHSHSRHKSLYGLPQAVTHQTEHPGCLQPSNTLVQRDSLLEYCSWLQTQYRVTCPVQLFQNLLWFTLC